LADDKHDIFISYAHRDNHDGWVEAFVAEIQKEHFRFSPRPLRVFLDLEGIRTMEASHPGGLTRQQADASHAHALFL
jgi:hypothetical protein